MSRPLLSIPVGVVVERRKAASPWIDFVWRPVAAMAGVPDAAPWTMLSQDGDAATFFAGSAAVELYPSDTAHYRDNLATGAPRLWVVLRPTGVEPPFDVVCVTADPNEGEGYTSAGNDIVDQVPMPEPIWDAIDVFIAEHHVERPFHKRQRTRADPEALARRQRIREADE